MAKKLVVKSPINVLCVAWERCNGCRLCETVCSIQHHNIVNPEVSRIRVHNVHPGPFSVPMVCSYCSDRPCARVCPEKAILYDEDRGIITVAKEKCLGVKCSICARACKGLRSDVIRFHPDDDYALICDKCGGEPRCVKVCPTGALDYQPERFMPDGKHFADPVDKIASDMAQKWLPASTEMRVKTP